MLPKRFIGYCPALIGSPQAIHWPVNASVFTRLKPCATARAAGTLNYNSVLSAFGCAALPRKPMVGFVEAAQLPSEMPFDNTSPLFGTVTDQPPPMPRLPAPVWLIGSLHGIRRRGGGQHVVRMKSPNPLE
ncbi:hypothetical protein [Burkholderia cepacia]|uniref:hypothetical protein n=1 Tax=Burkholderia cepacia TaxID=292 RepID=UPI002AB613C5|nr:hypothetical protein [Burkholderia cepacia]